MSRYNHYVEWRKKRINKIIKVMGEDFFRNASGLELACFQGHIGARLRELFNCVMTFADVRNSHQNEFVKNNPKVLLNIINQENEWNLNRQFDFIIHWGVLYHLDNWQQDLKCALQHSKVIFLESEVCDSSDPTFEIKVKEEKNECDQAFSGKGSRPSPAFIESVLDSQNAKWKRYDDEDINSDISNKVQHRYNWITKETKTWSVGLRRFWIIDNR